MGERISSWPSFSPVDSGMYVLEPGYSIGNKDRE
jgi:hypothetical protein